MMSTGSDDHRIVDDMLQDIELELASIKLTTDRERLDHARPATRLPPPPATRPPAKTIDARGIAINRMAADSLPKPLRPTQPQQEKARVSLAQRLALVRSEAAE